MSWASRYREQARVARMAAQQYARVGDEGKAAYYLDVAEVYEKLAEQSERR